MEEQCVAEEKMVVSNLPSHSHFSTCFWHDSIENVVLYAASTLPRRVVPVKKSSGKRCSGLRYSLYLWEHIEQ
jgi:hypothetical protein